MIENSPKNNTSTQHQMLDQRRAQDAWNKAKAAVKEHGKNYANEAKGLPALIMNSGLMQVMAFLHQKKEEHHKTLEKDLRDWLAKQCSLSNKSFEDFMNHLFELDARQYQRVTIEALAWLKWLRQMASALLKE